MGRLVPLLLVALAACGDRSPAPPEADRRPEADSARLDVPTPFDPAPLVFDTTEPAERVVEIPPREVPPPEPPPPPPAPPGGGPAGSCDVRETEGFCFAYTGEGWTPRTARAHCDAAPDAAFQPGTCPLLGRVATCAFSRPSEPDREVVYTYYEPFDVDLAALACPGTFTRLR